MEDKRQRWPPLLFDGAMGTYYAARCERECLDHPDEVAAIHRAYLEGGCRTIRTKAGLFHIVRWH